MSDQFSISPDGEKFSLPDPKDFPAEFDQHHKDRERYKAESKELDRKTRAIDNAIKAALGNAVEGRLPSGIGSYTWRPDKRGRRTLRFSGNGSEE